MGLAVLRRRGVREGKELGLGEAKFSPLPFIDLAGRGPKEMSKLGKYVMHTENRVCDALPLCDDIPGGSGGEREQAWPWVQRSISSGCSLTISDLLFCTLPVKFNFTYSPVTSAAVYAFLVRPGYVRGSGEVCVGMFLAVSGKSDTPRNLPCNSQPT